MSRILVAYLIAPGDEYAAAAGRFFASIQARDAGMDYDLLVAVKNGVKEVYTAIGDASSVTVIEHSNVGFDIQSLLTVAQHECDDYDWLVWFGSWSRILCDGWLRKLYDNAVKPGVGAAGATGSWESGMSDKHPNPHLRTNGLMINPLRLHQFGDVTNRRECYEFEHGYTSLYNTLQRQRLECLVVGVNGQGFQTHEWPSSATYRSGKQANLMVADKQTDAWQAGSQEQQLEWSRMAGWEPNA
jgi:hypothetical protein